jgi:hypothetical protein
MERLGMLSKLLGERNQIDKQLAALIGRPPSVGALGEYVAAAIFDVQLESSAVTQGMDGRFRSGPLAGRTVDIKSYGKREGLLDLPTHDAPADFHLVLTGPKGGAVSSRGATRPWIVDAVFVFDTERLMAQLRGRVKIGIATSVAACFWEEAEIYPRERSPFLRARVASAAERPVEPSGRPLRRRRADRLLDD